VSPRSVVSSDKGGANEGRSAFLITGLAVASLVASTAATARPIDKGHFHDVFTSDVYDCNGTPAQDSGDVSGNFVFNQRGSSPFPYYRESVHGTVVTTNLNTGGTYTNVFTVNSRDHTIVDNGDGTITITSFASGSSRFYDGNFVLKDPGQVRIAFDIDYKALPVIPATTSRFPTRSGSCADPRGTATCRTATSARTWWSSPARANQSTFRHGSATAVPASARRLARPSGAPRRA
jgi:hypothetical protein